MRKINLLSCMHNNLVWLNVLILALAFIQIHSMSTLAAKALMRLCICTGSSEPSLLVYAISTKVPRTGALLGHCSKLLDGICNPIIQEKCQPILYRSIHIKLLPQDKRSKKRNSTTVAYASLLSTVCKQMSRHD